MRKALRQDQLPASYLIVLAKRLLSALVVGGALFSLLWFFHHPYLIGGLIVLVGFLSGWELARLFRVSNIGQFLWALSLSAAVIGGMFLPIAWLYCLACIGFLIWCTLSIAMLFFRLPKSVYLHIPLSFIATIIAMLSLFTLYRALALPEPWLLLYFLSLVWITDSGAYFAGKMFGRHKIAPTISPGKTYEGFVGGLVCALAFTLLSALWINLDWPWVVASMAASVVSIVGDLYLSYLKRMAGIKDSGSLIPGHGGILDRVDSLLSAAPVFVFILFVLGHARLTA